MSHKPKKAKDIMNISGRLPKTLQLGLEAWWVINNELPMVVYNCNCSTPLNYDETPAPHPWTLLASSTITGNPKDIRNLNLRAKGLRVNETGTIWNNY